MDKVSIQRTLDPGSKTSSVFKQYLAGLVCSLLTFINGICIGWSSSAIPQLEDGVLSSGPVSQENLGWVGGMLCLGALVISPLPGLLADKKGRKFAAYVIAMFSIINWSFMLAATDLWQVLVGRAFAGIACAGALTVVPIYNNEVAEPRVKASIGGLMIVTYSIGILCSYILGAWLSFHTVAAVYLCFTAAFLPAWWFMPESPAYLLLNGNEKEALRVLKWLMGPEESVAQDALQRLKTEQDGAVKPVSIKQFFRDKAARKGLVLSYIIMTVQTFCGVFALQSYASSILSKAGGGISPTTGSIIYACVMVVGSLMPPLIADRLPRRVILGISLTFLAAGMATLGSFQYLQSQGINLSELGSLMGIVPIVVLSITVFFHFVGLGSVAYIAMMELFSDETRGVAGAFIAIAIWGTSFVLLQFFGMAVEAFGDYAVFFFFSSVSAFGLFFICAIFPETRGKSPSEMIAILSK